jgi:hypothetical protein
VNNGLSPPKDAASSLRYWLLETRLFDESGRDVPQTGAGWGREDAVAKYRYGLKLPKDAKTVDITLA